METRDMIRMLNQIAEFYKPYTQTEAIDGIERHVHAFWEPRMRKQLEEYMAETGGKDLLPSVVTAMTRYFEKQKQKTTAKKAPATAR
jgi:formate dehydrogenase subunit delta